MPKQNMRRGGGFVGDIVVNRLVLKLFTSVELQASDTHAWVWDTVATRVGGVGTATRRVLYATRLSGGHNSHDET